MRTRSRGNRDGVTTAPDAAANRLAVAVEGLEPRRLFASGLVPWATPALAARNLTVDQSSGVEATAGSPIEPVKVNFQPASAPAVSGYLIDSGQVFGPRNGQTYGWTVSHTDAVFDRNVNADQLLDTVVSIKAAARWELAVPNGSYTVKVSVGDALEASRNNIWVEGVSLISFQSQAANTYLQKTITVNVADGRLTIGVGSATTGSVRLNDVEVSPVVSPPPTYPPPTSPPPTSPPPTSPPPTSPPGTLAPPAVSASNVGTASMTINWTPPAGTDTAGVAKYLVRYVAGAYDVGNADDPRVVEVPATQTSLNVSGLLPFELYSIDVTRVDSSGKTGTGHANVYTAAPANQQRYLYTVNLPKNRTGFPKMPRQIEVYDIANGHKWVKNIPLPGGTYNVRGVAANVVTNRIYVTYFLNGNGGDQPGGIMALDLTTGQLVWKKDLPPSVVPAPDRFDVTPDGKTIYLPVGEDGVERYWAILNAADGSIIGKVEHVSSPHNTIVSLDGTRVFLEGQEKHAEPADVKHTIGVVDTATQKIVGKVGPFRDVIRPFTVNGKGSLVFATVNNFVGFQIGDVATGKVLYTAAPPNYSQPDPTLNISHSHGILLTPNEKEVWVVDTRKVGIHVFDVSKVPNGPPTYVKFIAVRRQGKDLSGNTSASAWNDTIAVPSWLNISHDGKYVYAEGGEIIDTATKQVVGQLQAKWKDANGNLVQGPYSHSRFMLEVDFVNGQPVRATDQFGVGLVR